MSNENEEVIDETEEDALDEAPEGEAIDWEARAKKLEEKAIAQRAKTKELRNQLSKLTPKQQEDKAEKGLDRLDRAILRVEKITAPNEIQLVEDIVKETGRSLEQVLESKYFKSELAAMREEQATKDATPSGTKRAGQSTSGEVDYWIAKGELPPPGPLRSKVVQAKRAIAKNTNTFSDTPVVS